MIKLIFSMSHAFKIYKNYNMNDYIAKQRKLKMMGNNCLCYKGAVIFQYYHL